MLQKTAAAITQSPKVYWICLDSEAVNVALLSMVDVRDDTIVRPISGRLVIVCEM